jgi:hypothetical protein
MSAALDPAIVEAAQRAASTAPPLPDSARPIVTAVLVTARRRTSSVGGGRHDAA